MNSGFRIIWRDRGKSRVFFAYAMKCKGLRKEKGLFAEENRR
jgi:hypothetical protein